MKPGTRIILLIVLFLLVFGIRSYYSFQTDEFSDDFSYFMLRQVDEITSTGTPLFNDDLSYGGKLNIFTPLYYYIISFFSLFLGVSIATKLIPALFASLIIFVAYLISLKLTNNKNMAFLTAIVTGFVPVFYTVTVNKLNINSISVPLMFLMLYFFMKSTSHKYLILYLVSLVILSLITPMAFLAILSFLLYLLIIKLGNLKLERREIEIILFSTFFFVWVSFLFFKKALIFHGPSFIWQNIPAQLLTNYFSEITINLALYKIGIIPFLTGIFVIYKNAFKNKNKDINLLLSFIFSIGLMLWFKLIQLDIGLMFLGISLALLFGNFMLTFLSYLKKTKFYFLKNAVFALLFLLILITLFNPSIVNAKDSLENTPKSSVMKALKWFNENSEDNATIISIFENGHQINYFAKRKNIMDSNFFLVEDTTERYDDIERIYKTKSEIEAIRLMNKHNTNYLLLSFEVRKKLDIEEISYIEEDLKEDKCFELVYDYVTKIYKLTCTVD